MKICFKTKCLRHIYNSFTRVRSTIGFLDEYSPTGDHQSEILLAILLAVDQRLRGRPGPRIFSMTEVARWYTRNAANVAQWVEAYTLTPQNRCTMQQSFLTVDCEFAFNRILFRFNSLCKPTILARLVNGRIFMAISWDSFLSSVESEYMLIPDSVQRFVGTPMNSMPINIDQMQVGVA